MPQSAVKTHVSGNIQDSFLCDVTDSSFFKGNYILAYTLNHSSPPRSLLFRSFCAFSWRILSLNEQRNKHELLRSHLRQVKEEDRICKLPLQISLCVFLFLLTNSRLVKVSAAKGWASLHWHCFKRALPVSQKRRGQVCKGHAVSLSLSCHTLSLSGTQGSDCSQDFYSPLSG